MTLKVGDRVSYHGSLEYYHEYEFTITKLFEFNDIGCAMLQGPRMDIWIERCRVSNLRKLDDN